MSATAELPDDLEMLKAMLVALRTENETLKAVNADAEARMARLTALLKVLERARYGRRSEALDAEQHAFAFEEIETGLSAAKAGLEAVKQTPKEKAPRQRKALPAHLASASRSSSSRTPRRAPVARATGSRSARTCRIASTWCRPSSAWS